MCQLFSSKLEEMTGIFAITFALHSLLGEALQTVKYDQTKMRDKCLKRKEFDQFPTKSTPGFQSWHFPYREIELLQLPYAPDTWKDTMIVIDAIDGTTQSMLDSSLFQQWTSTLCTV